MAQFEENDLLEVQQNGRTIKVRFCFDSPQYDRGPRKRAWVTSKPTGTIIVDVNELRFPEAFSEAG